jgi:hypothetical protein
MSVATKGAVVSESSAKSKRREAFNAKLEAIADAFAKVLAESVQGTLYFTLEDLDSQNILYYRPRLGWETSELRQSNDWIAAGRLLDRMRSLIKDACKHRGDFWYEVTMDDGWEIVAQRGSKKR